MEKRKEEIVKIKREKVKDNIFYLYAFVFYTLVIPGIFYISLNLVSSPRKYYHEYNKVLTRGNFFSHEPVNTLTSTFFYIIPLVTSISIYFKLKDYKEKINLVTLAIYMSLHLMHFATDFYKHFCSCEVGLILNIISVWILLTYMIIINIIKITPYRNKITSSFIILFLSFIVYPILYQYIENLIVTSVLLVIVSITSIILKFNAKTKNILLYSGITLAGVGIFYNVTDSPYGHNIFHIFGSLAASFIMLFQYSIVRDTNKDSPNY